MARFGELLAELRQDRNMTQKELADILYVTTGTVSNYENDKHLPDVDGLERIAGYFHVTTDYLLGRCGANLSPDVFDEEFAGGVTLGEVIAELKGLTPERKRTILQVLRDMRAGMLLDGFSNRKEV